MGIYQIKGKTVEVEPLGTAGLAELKKASCMACGTLSISHIYLCYHHSGRSIQKNGKFYIYHFILLKNVTVQAMATFAISGSAFL